MKTMLDGNIQALPAWFGGPPKRFWECECFGLMAVTLPQPPTATVDEERKT